MEPWMFGLLLVAVFFIAASVAYFTRIRRRESRVVPRRCVEHYEMSILDFEEMSRPHLALIPLGLAGLALGVLIYMGKISLGEDVRMLIGLGSSMAGVSLVAIGLFRTKTVTDEHVGLEITKQYVSEEPSTIREKVDLTSDFTILSTVNRLYFKYRAPCNSERVVAKFVTLLASNIYLKAISFWEALLDRLSEMTYTVVVFPLDDAVVSEKNKEWLKKYAEAVMSKSGAVIPVQLKYFVGEPEETKKCFEKYVSKPISILATANLLFGEHIRRRVSKRFLYLAYACKQVTSSSSSDIVDVFSKALEGGLLARFEESEVSYILCLPAGSDLASASKLKEEAEKHQEVLKKKFRNAKVEVVDHIILDNVEPNHVFITLVFVCNTSLQFKNFKKSLEGGEKYDV